MGVYLQRDNGGMFMSQLKSGNRKAKSGSGGEGCRLQAVGYRNFRYPISHILSSARGAALALTLALSGAAQAQVPINSSSAVTENFNTLGTGATASLPSGWKMSAAGAGTTAGYATVANLTAVNAAAGSGTPTTGARYNWGDGTTSTDRAIGFMTSGSYASPNGIMVQYQNNTGSTITALAVSFDFYKPEEGKKLHVIVADDFVTADEGTGIVTIAPYGEEDLKVMTRDNIQIVLNIDDEGHLTFDNPNGWGGMFYLKANKYINEDLKNRNLMFHEDPNHAHTVAFCWRCHERLIYKPQEAWYVDVQKLKPTMAKTNESVNWYPSHFKYGRFAKSMEGAPDWCISRSRYWGSPVPVWECECGERFVPGSIADLEKASGTKITDLHKPEIDEVYVNCAKCGKKAKRVTEVLDSWIEAGSASFAERHFPFEEKENLKSFFPPDFISEYTGQIRAWFYVLHVIAAAIYGEPAFKNVLVSGVILGTDGRKMSKNYKNYPDPREVIEKYGGDALRLYLLGSPITKAEDIKISEAEYRDQLRLFVIPLLNIWNFVEMYAKTDNYELRINDRGLDKENWKGWNVLDKWLVSRLHTTVDLVTESFENYDTMSLVKQLVSFVDEWSRWYLRRSRDRIGSSELTEDGKNFYKTSLYVFETFLRLIAPVVPFHSEYLYKKLTGDESVHLKEWPKTDKDLIHQELEKNMQIAREICEVGHQIRKQNNQKVRTPLASISVKIDKEAGDLHENTWEVVLAELNVKNIVVNESIRYPKSEVIVTEDELIREGQLRDLAREVQALEKKKA